MEDILRLFLFSALGSLVISVGVAYYLVYRIYKPISQLKQATEKIGAGDIKRIRIENDEPEEEDYSAPAATASLPKTGDGGNLTLWLGMVLLGLLGAGVTVAKRR